jgi:hypothetical protein
MPQPDNLSSLFGAAAAGQRLDPLYLFARLLVEGGVAEVDVPVQARVRVVLVVGCCVEGIAGRRYSVLVHRGSSFLWAGLRGVGDSCGAIYVVQRIILRLWRLRHCSCILSVTRPGGGAWKS